MTKEQIEILEKSLNLLEDLDYEKEDYDLGYYNGKKYCGYCFVDLTIDNRYSKHKNCEYFELIEKLENWIKDEERIEELKKSD